MSFFPSRAGHLYIRTGKRIRNHENSLHACSFFSNPFLEFCLFFHHLVPHICPSIRHIENYRALLWNQGYSEKGDLPEHFASTFLLLCHFHMNLKYKTLPLAVFYRQSLSCEVIDESQGDRDLNSSNSNYFPLCPPLSISKALLFFEVSTSIFCVLIWQSQSFHTICFRIFASPVI